MESGLNNEENFENYREEILRYLIELESQLVPRGDYLQDNPEITSNLRDELIEWMINTGEEMNISVEAVQLSIILFDKICGQLNLKRQVLQLTGTVCLLIGIKFHDSDPNVLFKLIEETGNIYTKEDLRTVETYIMQKVMWILPIPTPAELTRQLFLITAVDYDFTRIFEKSDAFAMVCYRNYGLSEFSPLAIAIVSGVCALEEFKEGAFRDEWIGFLNEKIELELPVLDECKRNLVHYLYGIGSISHESLDCLKNSISNCIY